MRSAEDFISMLQAKGTTMATSGGRIFWRGPDPNQQEIAAIKANKTELLDLLRAIPGTMGTIGGRSVLLSKPASKLDGNEGNDGGDLFPTPWEELYAQVPVAFRSIELISVATATRDWDLETALLIKWLARVPAPPRPVNLQFSRPGGGPILMSYGDVEYCMARLYNLLALGPEHPNAQLYKAELIALAEHIGGPYE